MSQQQSTLAELLRDKPKRGRPRLKVSRQNVYVALSKAQKEAISTLAKRLPGNFSRADVAELSVMVLGARFEALRRAVSSRTREIPEGITDLESLYVLWDLPTPPREAETKWTSIRLTSQQTVELGRLHGTLNALFQANRSEVFSLGVALLDYFLANDLPAGDYSSIPDLQEAINSIYL